MIRFPDRAEAGRLLADKLENEFPENAVVLALPHGGIPLAIEVARRFDAPLDLLAVKKIGAPGAPEFAVGAISENEKPILHEDVIDVHDFDRAEIARIAADKRREMRAQLSALREVLPPTRWKGRPVVVVDDGLATGATMEAAIPVLRERGVTSILIAVPVSSAEAKRKLELLVDRFVALHVPTNFHAVGAWYRDFSQVSREEALRMLEARDRVDREASGKKRRGSRWGPADPVTAEILAEARPLNAASIAELARSVAGKRVVMLGESSHGTDEFYRVRRQLTAELIANHGFGFVAVEGDWPDSQRIHRYATGKESGSARSVLERFRRWPTWMWANDEIEILMGTLRRQGTGFYGLDVYSLFESIDAVRKILSRFDPVMAKRVSERYACFDPFGRDEIRYARSLAKMPEGCHEQAISTLRELLRLRLNEIGLNEADLFDLQQNARIVNNAERYYRSMVGGEAESWNIRDHHMMETLELLLRRAGPNGKAIVWAHNTHVGDYHATDMLEEGNVNLGGLARERLGADGVALIGFGTYEGTVLAGPAWGATPRVMEVPPAMPGSWEDVLHSASVELERPNFWLPLAPRGPLAERRGHRAIGVVYDPRFEDGGRNHVPTNLALRYDCFVFLDRTRALNPIATVTQQGMVPETWPMGL